MGYKSARQCIYVVLKANMVVQAYMYGFYNSKRIVLYDTLISQVH